MMMTTGGISGCQRRISSQVSSRTFRIRLAAWEPLLFADPFPVLLRLPELVNPDHVAARAGAGAGAGAGGAGRAASPVRVGEGVVGFGDLPEPVSGVAAVVHVRVILLGQLAVGLLDLLHGGVGLHKAACQCPRLGWNLTRLPSHALTQHGFMNARCTGTLIALCWVCAISAFPVSYGLRISAAEAADAATGMDGLPDAPSPSDQVTVKGLPLAILKDQIPIWTSPVRIRPHDLVWLLPLGAATGITLATDTDAMRDLSRDPAFNKDCVNTSNYLLGGQIAMPAILFGIGVAKNNTHAKETGILSGEALADAVIVEQISKLSCVARGRCTTMPPAISSLQMLALTARFPLHTACWPGQWLASWQVNIHRGGCRWASTQPQQE